MFIPSKDSVKKLFVVVAFRVCRVSTMMTGKERSKLLNIITFSMKVKGCYVTLNENHC